MVIFLWPIRPSLPWCFPVRDPRFCSSQQKQPAAASSQQPVSRQRQPVVSSQDSAASRHLLLAAAAAVLSGGCLFEQAAAAVAAGGSGVALFRSSFRRDVRQFFVIWRCASSIQKPFLALSSGATTTEVAAEQLTAGAG